MPTNMRMSMKKSRTFHPLLKYAPFQDTAPKAKILRQNSTKKKMTNRMSVAN
jgi:hypothetical protein